MVLEMKVPSPGESITEVEIAQWLVADGDYVEKDQAIAEVDSDKATLELPAEASGIITLKAAEGDAVAVGEVVCLIDTSAKKPKGDKAIASDGKIDTYEKSGDEGSNDNSAKDLDKEEKKAEKTNEKAEPEKGNSEKEKSYALGTPSPSAKKILDEKNIKTTDVQGSGREGRITKEDAINAHPSMGTPGPGKRGEERKKLSMLRRKVAERLVSAKNRHANHLQRSGYVGYF